MSFERGRLIARRAFVAGGSWLLAPGGRARSQKIRAVALDAFTVLDPRPIVSVAERLFPNRGARLCELWRSRQFEYAWLRTLAGTYTDFWRVTEDALVFAARMAGIEATSESRALLMKAYLELPAWPDVEAALASLQQHGVRVVMLSNFTAAMMSSPLGRAGLTRYFDGLLTCDAVRAYKPDPRAYRMATKALKLDPGEIAYAAFAGWDAAGAKAFGFPTFWVNRATATPEELGAPVDAQGSGLLEFARYATE